MHYSDPKYLNNRPMHFHMYNVFYSQCSHYNVSARIPVIFRVMFLLQEYKRTNLVKVSTSPITISTFTTFWYAYITNKIQNYTVYLSLETALHVSGGISTHHQEHTQLYLQHLALVKPLLLPVAIVEALEYSSNASTIKTGSIYGLTSAVDTVFFFFNICGSEHHAL